MRTARHRLVTGVFVPALVSMTCFVGRPAAEEESPNATRTEPTTENALAEIIAIPNRFDRDAALYRFVADADRQRIEALLAALAAEPGAPPKDDVARVLYVRFVSIEPGPAVAHALRNYPKPQILETVFRAWAHVDLEAAVARASDLSIVMKRDAARPFSISTCRHRSVRRLPKGLIHDRTSSRSSRRSRPGPPNPTIRRWPGSRPLTT